MGWAWQHSPYRGSALTVHLALADVANDVHQYELWTLTRTIAAKARVSPGTARRVLLQMVDDGYLELLDDRSDRNQASRYRFLMPAEGRAPRATPDPEGRVRRATGRASDATQVAHHARQVAHHARPREQKELNEELNPEPNTLALIAETPVDPVAEFARFWSAYPRRVSKGHAEKAWRSAVKVAHPDEIIAAAERYAAHVAATRTEQRFVPHPATWINGQRWLDDLPEPTGRARGIITDRDTPTRVLSADELWGDDDDR